MHDVNVLPEKDREMRHVFKLISGIIWFAFTIVGNAEVLVVDGVSNIYNSGTAPYIGGEYTSITVKNNGKATFEGSVKSNRVTVEAGSVMIVYGDLDANCPLGANVNISGTLIVTGSFDIQSPGMSEDITINETGILVVGGNYSFGGNRDVNNGNGYFSDPTEGSGFSGTGSIEDIEALINSGILPDDLLMQFIENYYGANLPADSWEGNVNTDWNDAGNWALGSVPGVAINVTIPTSPVGGSVYPQLCANGVFKMWNLTLEDGAQFVIPVGSQATIYGTITIKGSAQLVVENSNANPTSFLNYKNVVDENGNPANITFKWTYDNLRWWFVGHPISNPTRDSYQDLRLNQSNDYALYDYQDPNVFYKVSDMANTYDLAAQNVLKGYNFKVLNTGAVVTHTGLLNNESVYEKDLQTEWQVIANPYASYYQIPSASSGDIDFENTVGTIYVTVSTSNADKVFETYNVNSDLGSPVDFTGLIAPNQAFYVKTATPGKVFMRAVNRVHDVNKGQLKSARSSEKDVVRITLNNGAATDEAVLAFREQGSMSYSKFDSDQRFQESSIRSFLYSIKDSVKTVINMLPKNTELEVPLGYKAKVGEHTIQLNGIGSLTDNLEMFLEDKVLGEKLAVTADFEYRFTVEDETDNDRFVLHINPAPIAAVVEEEELVEDKKIDEGMKVYMSDANLNIVCDWEAAKKTVSVYSVLGKQLIQEDFQSNYFSKVLLLSKGVYIVKVVAGHKKYEQKIAVR